MTGSGDGQDRRLSGGERRQLAVLGLPTFAMALSITTVSTYLPVVARQFTSSTIVIGLLIAGEGVMALWIPIIAGSWSDRLETPIGSRLPFVLVGTPLMAAALLALGALGSLWSMAIIVSVFFAGYFVAYEPYRALYPDLLDDSVAGRAQSNQAAWRGGGTILALVSGGALLGLATFLPFVGAAFVLIVAMLAFARFRIRDIHGERRARDLQSVGEAFAKVKDLLAAHPALRAYVIANAMWEMALAALKTFIVLYVTVGLGYSLGQSSLIIGAVAVVIVGGALLSGKLADRFGGLRVMNVGLWFYGLALVIPAATANPVVLIVAVPLIAAGGGMIMGLPYALLMPLMPPGEHGALTGVYSVSRGIGTMLGPLAAGLAIQFLEPLYSSTSGYGAMWLVVAASILLSIPVTRRLRARSEDRRELSGEAGDRDAAGRSEAAGRGEAAACAPPARTSRGSDGDARPPRGPPRARRPAPRASS
jgi:MFS family permease